MVGNQLYILDANKKVVALPEDSVIKWGMWMGLNDRIVARVKVGDATVSTVFLGIDHRFGDDGPPLLWETMIFGGKHDQYQKRCAGTWEQAEAMHERALGLLKGDE